MSPHAPCRPHPVTPGSQTMKNPPAAPLLISAKSQKPIYSSTARAQAHAYANANARSHANSHASSYTNTHSQSKVYTPSALLSPAELLDRLAKRATPADAIALLALRDWALGLPRSVIKHFEALSKLSDQLSLASAKCSTAAQKATSDVLAFNRKIKMTRGTFGLSNIQNNSFTRGMMREKIGEEEEFDSDELVEDVDAFSKDGDGSFDEEEEEEEYEEDHYDEEISEDEDDEGEMGFAVAPNQVDDGKIDDEEAEPTTSSIGVNIGSNRRFASAPTPFVSSVRKEKLCRTCTYFPVQREEADLHKEKMRIGSVTGATSLHKLRSVIHSRKLNAPLPSADAAVGAARRKLVRAAVERSKERRQTRHEYRKEWREALTKTTSLESEELMQLLSMRRSILRDRLKTAKKMENNYEDGQGERKLLGGGSNSIMRKEDVASSSRDIDQAEKVEQDSDACKKTALKTFTTAEPNKNSTTLARTSLGMQMPNPNSGGSSKDDNGLGNDTRKENRTEATPLPNINFLSIYPTNERADKEHRSGEPLCRAATRIGPFTGDGSAHAGLDVRDFISRIQGVAKQYDLSEREAALLAVSRLRGKALHAVVMHEEDRLDMTRLSNIKQRLLAHIAPMESKVNAWKRVDAFQIEGAKDIRQAINQLYHDIARCGLEENVATELVMESLPPSISLEVIKSMNALGQTPIPKSDIFADIVAAVWAVQVKEDDGFLEVN